MSLSFIEPIGQFPYIADDMVLFFVDHCVDLSTVIDILFQSFI